MGSKQRFWCHPCLFKYLKFRETGHSTPTTHPNFFSSRLKISQTVRAQSSNAWICILTAPEDRAVPSATAYPADQNKSERLLRDATPLLHTHLITCRRPAHLYALLLTSPRRYRRPRCNL